MSQGGMAKVPTAAVLKNRGVPVNLHPVHRDEDTGRWVRTCADGDDSRLVPLEEQYVRFTMATLADLEEQYGDIEKWSEALRDRPMKALTVAIACALDWREPGGGPDWRRAGEAMLDGEIAAYSTAVGGAYMLAQGFTPEKTGEVLRAGLAEVAKQTKKLASVDVAKLLNDSLSDDDTPTSPPADPTSQLSTQRGRDATAILSSSGV